MADASCGPSNAFKGLARHIEQDRSHQQDRIVSGSQQPSQGFRSTPLNPGLASQFDAFLQRPATLPNFPVGDGELLPHPAQAPPLFPSQPIQKPATFAQGATSSWINEFQRMSLSDAHARSLHAQSAQGPAIGQPSLTDPLHLNIPPSGQHPLFQPYQPPTTGLYPMQPQFGAFQAGSNTHAPQLMDDASFALNAQAEVDLEQEFEDAMNEWMRQNGPETEEPKAQDGTDLTASLDAASAETTADETAEEESEGNEEQQTELARAAQQLVDLLADNDTEKFKNSEFISLMRRIASRQLTVQGNDLVETSQPSSTDNGTAAASP